MLCVHYVDRQEASISPFLEKRGGNKKKRRKTKRPEKRKKTNAFILRLFFISLPWIDGPQFHACATRGEYYGSIRYKDCGVGRSMTNGLGSVL